MGLSSNGISSSMGEIITKAEQEELLNWICTNWNTTLSPNGHPLKRTLFFTLETPEYPPLLKSVFFRILEREGLPFRDLENKNDIHFRHILACILPGGRLDFHTDDIWRGKYQCRFNLTLLQPQKGAKTWYDGHLIEIQERHYHVCRSSLDPHWVDENHDTIPRIVISFCYMMTKTELNTKYPARQETKDSNIRVQRARAEHEARVRAGEAYAN
jgi:hypothetical protein